MLDAGTRTPDSRFEALLQVRPHHLRSVQIERDFADPHASLYYVVTPFIRATAQRLAAGFRSGSTERAWRLTGDYGSGKSSFALALARLGLAEKKLLPQELQDYSATRRLEPVLVVGEREPVGQSVLRALRTTAKRRFARIPRALDTALNVTPEPPHVVAALDALRAALIADGKAAGLLVILDELGKNLEFAATQHEADDIYLLQHLAELAARSGDQPVMVVAIVHQAIAGYASQLTSAHRREWEKVAGRYEEVVFSPPLEQAATLIAAALDVDVNACSAPLVRAAERTMASALDQNWYGSGVSRAAMVDLAPALLPLDATVLPVISRAMRRFGQNERSLFSFLSSTEPFGLMAHAQRPVDGFRPYRLHDFFDYLSANFASLLGSGAHATRWNQIREILRSAETRAPDEEAVLKTVALLNLIDDPSLPPTREAVLLAVAGMDKRANDRARAAITRLSHEARILYDRGVAGALCLWPHTSVDLDQAFAAAERAIGPIDKTFDHLKRLVRTDPIVARRHYVERGALRHFELICLDSGRFEQEVQTAIEPDTHAPDGRVVLLLSATEQAREDAWGRLAHCTLPETTVVGLPRPTAGLDPLLCDVLAWRWVRDHVPALAGDRIARTEVSRQLALAEERLTRTLGGLLDVRGSAAVGIRWRDRDGERQFASSRSFVSHLSDLCDRAFSLCPRVSNELINRRTLSTAAARARSLLIEALATNADQPGLGLSSQNTPPERAIYLSVLQKGGIHVQREGRWEVRIPEGGEDRLNFAPALNAIARILKAVDKPVGYEVLATRLRGTDFGMRDGLIPLVIAIYLRATWHETAVYEDGTYLEQVGGPEFTRITKEPEHFEFQHCAIEGVRAELYVQLGAALETRLSERPALLDIVRPLMTFVGKQLPDHSRRTRRLSPATLAARGALLSGRDPSALLFTDLPKAFDIEAIGPETLPGSEAVARYVKAMAGAIRELRDAYPRLLNRLAAAIGAALETDEDLPKLRPPVLLRGRALVPALVEPELRAFVLRLADEKLDDTAWLESIASFVARKPAERWTDSDEEEFHQRLAFFTRRFRQVETIHFPGQGDDDSAYRIAVTCADGRQIERIFRTTAEQEAAIKRAETELAPLLERTGRIGRIAAARLLLAAADDEDADVETSSKVGSTS
ncbi:hypothetical protein [Mesorhizobium sp. WSM3873]|uniref:hypothetical protein n=1 Tax=Mesorhizobium sp. WSM3873 TaxID=1854056 RepID=UPI000801917C|nr:hypothetical protein [Mesorhizobium sp. WSM3873]OBQ86432.1 hypothetical protein A9K71_17010 [Mesorhizobium sp. WSM3873]TJW91360.1 MAG: hypothetical protein E5V92_00210 [Mesorhizobium sp.]